MPDVNEDLNDWPPFNHEHYYNHTPAGPNPRCPNCKHLNSTGGNRDPHRV